MMLIQLASCTWAWSISSARNSIITLVALFVVLLAVQAFRRPSLLAIPGPVMAKVTDLWLARQAIRGNRSEVIHDLHQKHGPMVRIAPNHVSVALPDALQQIYGHSTGTLKADFYEAFSAPTLPNGLFSTRCRADHARKRKIVSHVFAPKSVAAFEPFIRREIQALVDRFRELSSSSSYSMDMLMWMNYFAFDTIGSLAFGTAFGMIEQGKADADVDLKLPDGSIQRTSCNAVKIINERGEYAATMGVVARYLRPTAAMLPWFSRRLTSVNKLTGIALARVNDHLKNGSERDDLLAKLSAGTDEKGDPMGKDELVSEALTQLIAGSDTIANTSTAIIYHICHHPDALRKLQAELDDKLVTLDEDVPLADDVQTLPYLTAVINETLRIHSTSALGLPRIIPAGGITIHGKLFPEGTILSVPTYTIHRNKEIWGDDAEDFRPERWLKQGAFSHYGKAFNPFSFGPRQCVGRNLGLIELQLLIATMFKHFNFELVYPEAPLQTFEGFLRKPVTLPIKVSARSTKASA